MRLTDTQVRKLVGLLVEAAEEHGELRNERGHVDEHEILQVTQRIDRALGRRQGLHDVLLLLVAPDAAEVPF